MKRLLALLAVAAAFAVAFPLSAFADPPPRPPGCTVVATTPADETGSAQGQANKAATFARVCGP